MNVRAKFTVTKISEFGDTGGNRYMCYDKNDQPTDIPLREITMSAVCGGSGEDQSFAAATPSGTITFMLNNPVCGGEFKPGQTYYVDFSPATA